MNIFFLHPDPKICARYHNDKHVVKMIIEYAQLMSTAHRVIDGTEYYDLTKNGRKIKRWKLNDDLENSLMKASHINHPSAVWARENKENYMWLYAMWYYLLEEYTYRYGKIHSCARLKLDLSFAPKKISLNEFTQPTPAMPDEVKTIGDSLVSYRNYYIHNKKHLASWKIRGAPNWYPTQ